MRTPQVAIVTALVGLYVGILGLIIAVSSNAFGLAALVWAIGLIVLLGAYLQARWPPD